VSHSRGAVQKKQDKKKQEKAEKAEEKAEEKAGQTNMTLKRHDP
jgi:hypothetical protein